MLLNKVAEGLLAWFLSKKSGCHHALLLTLGCIVGCGGDPATGSVSPGSIAAGAITALDADGNGQLSEKELKTCPGMLKALRAYDKDSDGSISADEIEARWKRVAEMPDVPQTPICRVTRRGRPLNGVTVLLDPEPFLEGAVSPGKGETDRDGTCQPKAEGSPGVAAGIYKVRITDPQGKIPAKYNTETILGVELSFDLGRDAESIQFDLDF